jgi:serine-type D-Ala-D-Ala carboxypeptidase (penicillin-binding protein 5/6)
MLRMFGKTRNQNSKRIIIAAACVLTVGLIPNWEGKVRQLEKLQVLGAGRAPISDIHAAPELVAVIENPGITARAALAYDFQSGSILYTYNFDEKLPVASLTKIISALVIMDSGKLNTYVTVEEQDIRVIGVNTGLVVGERIRVSELMKAMLISSHNDSTLALSRHVGGTVGHFVELMNEKAGKLGMENSHFMNPVGFDDPNHYSTAQDLTLALREFMSHQELRELVKTKETEIRAQNLAFGHKLKTTNKLLLDDPSIIGVKTGYTTEAKGNLVIRSVRGNADVVTIVLGSDDREGDTRKILDWIYTVYKW